MDRLPAENFGQVLRKLSVVDRLQCKGVNRLWKARVSELGWTEQKKLSAKIVFEGANESQKEKFDNESLIALFRHIGTYLIELDLGSFFDMTQRHITFDICQWLHLLLKLAKLSITRIELQQIVEFLPVILIEFEYCGRFDEQSLTALSEKCPNLQSIRFRGRSYGPRVSVSVMKAFFEKYPRLEKLSLAGDFIVKSEATDSLTALAQLEWLEQLHLEGVSVFDDAALMAVAKGCPELWCLKLEHIRVSEEAIQMLDEHPNLLDFELITHPVLDNHIRETINEHWKMRKYKMLCSSQMFTDDFILRETLKELISIREYFSRIPGKNIAQPTDAAYLLIRRGILSLLHEALSSTNAVLQLEASEALVNILRKCYDERIPDVVEAGIVEKLMELLDSSENKKIIEQSLDNLKLIIAKGGSEYRDHCIGLGLLEQLLNFVSDATPIEILRGVARIIETICVVPHHTHRVLQTRCELQKPISIDTVLFILPALENLIQTSDASIIFHAARALSHIASRGNDQIQRVIDLGIVPRLVSLLIYWDQFKHITNSNNGPVDQFFLIRAAAISTLANIAAGTEEHKKLLLDLGVLKMMPDLISNPNTGYASPSYPYCGITENVVRFLGAIAAGNEHQHQAVFDTGLIPVIIQLFIQHCPTEGLRAISNIAKNGRSEHVHYLVDYGVIPPFCGKLICGDKLLNVLVVLKIILEKSGTRTGEVCEKIKRYGGLDRIKNLIGQKSEDIQKVAKEIIDEYFPLDID